MSEGLSDLKISLDQTSEVKCEECGSTTFSNSLMLRKVSGLLTGTGQPSYIPIPVFTCVGCNHINEEFLPREVKNLDS